MKILMEAGRYLAGSEKSRIRQLRAMRRLDERLLIDIGLTAADARRGYPLRSRPQDAELLPLDVSRPVPDAMSRIAASA